MPKTIVINLNDPKTVKDAIKTLKERKKVIEQKTEELAKRLAELGSSVAQLRYGSGIDVSYEQIDNGYMIHANGEQVCFLEFGAGVGTNTAHPYKDAMPFDVAPGSWSIQNAKQFSTWGYWIFGGRRYEKVEPTNAMYNACMDIQQQVYKIAKEVFR